jgi:cytochrome P450
MYPQPPHPHALRVLVHNTSRCWAPSALANLKLVPCIRIPPPPIPAGLEDIKALPYVRQALAESLRMYPQPPLLIRRALAPDTLPPGLNGDPEGYPIGAGGWVGGLLKGRREVGERDGGGGCGGAVGKGKGGRGG